MDAAVNGITTVNASELHTEDSHHRPTKRSPDRSTVQRVYRQYNESIDKLTGQSTVQLGDRQYNRSIDKTVDRTIVQPVDRQ